MNVSRRGAVALLAFAAALSPVPSSAQPATSKPIKFIVPFGPGGSGDTLARLIGQHLSERIRPAGDRRKSHGRRRQYRLRRGGEVRAGRRDAAGGCELPRDRSRALQEDDATIRSRISAPVTLIGSIPFVLVVNNAVPAKSVAELIALAKSKPNEFAYATPGLGTSTHLATERFKQQTGTEIRHVPYRANPLAMNDVIGGQIQVFFDFVTTGAPQVQGGKVRGLATSGAKRSHVLPDLPTMIEAGVPDFDVSTWLAIFARAGTPRPVVDRLHNEIVAILALPAVKERLATLGYDVAAAGPDKLAALMKSDTAQWAAVIQKAGIERID